MLVSTTCYSMVGIGRSCRTTYMVIVFYLKVWTWKFSLKYKKYCWYERISCWGWQNIFFKVRIRDSIRSVPVCNVESTKVYKAWVVKSENHTLQRHFGGHGGGKDCCWGHELTRRRTDVEIHRPGPGLMGSRSVCVSTPPSVSGIQKKSCWCREKKKKNWHFWESHFVCSMSIFLGEGRYVCTVWRHV